MLEPAAPRANYVLGIYVEGIRCFGPGQSLTLQTSNGQAAPWTLILGNNGIGKTTLLECIAWLGFRAEQGSAEALQRSLREGKYSVSSFVDWQQSLRRFGVGRPGPVISAVYSESKSLREQSKTTSHPPITYAYGVHRGLAAVSPTFETESRPWSLFLNEPDLVNAEEWLLRLDYSASKPSDIQDQQRKNLHRCKDLILKILPDNEVQDVRITTPTRARPDPHVEFKTPYGWVPLRQLGHGFRSVIAWMVDLAYRMTERYPNSPDPLAEPALVLVDEIDLHLHPVWQRQLMGYLSARFPNTQFVATAHSPLIVQAATDDTSIALLRRAGDHVEIDNDVKSIRNWRIDQILTSGLFDVPTARPPDLDRKLLRRTELLEKPELEPADQDELSLLEQQIGPLPTGESASDAMRSVELLERTQQLLEKYKKAE